MLDRISEFFDNAACQIYGMHHPNYLRLIADGKYVESWNYEVSKNEEDFVVYEVEATLGYGIFDTY